MQIIYLDISNKGVVPTVYAKQGDVGRKFEVIFTNSGLPYAPPDGSVFSVWYSGSSGEGNYTDIGDRSAFSVNENKVAVEMISQMLTNDGNGVLCLVLNESNGNQIGSWNIPYICEKIPGFDSEEAKSYYTAFSNAVKYLPYPDASLSAPGKAADAAAAGMALSGKAPAGFGLGLEEPEKRVDDLNDAVETGTYWFPTGAANAPTNSGEWVHTESYGKRFKHQTAFVSYTGGNVVERWMLNGEWQPWEWVNPPMTIGEEYRTAERWNGKAVYTKLVNYGGMPAQTTWAVAHGCAATNILRHCAVNETQGMPIPNHITSIIVDKTNITLTNNTPDLKNNQCRVRLWYTKD